MEDTMDMNLKRLGGWALMIGAVVASVGYVAANLLAPGSGDEMFRYDHWQLFEGIALAGDVIVALGMPVILTFAARSPKLHIVGYVGVFASLVMLNVGEGTTEAFVKPYLVDHGGIPTQEPTGFAVFEGVALLALVVGSICLGIGMLRARTLPWWVGVTLLVSCLVGAASLPSPWFLLSDVLVFATLFAIGTFAVRGRQAPLPVVEAPARVGVAS
jgi:hypothetical protein